MSGRPNAVWGLLTWACKYCVIVGLNLGALGSWGPCAVAPLARASGRPWCNLCLTCVPTRFFLLLLLLLSLRTMCRLDALSTMFQVHQDQWRTVSAKKEKKTEHALGRRRRGGATVRRCAGYRTKLWFCGRAAHHVRGGQGVPWRPGDRRRDHALGSRNFRRVAAGCSCRLRWDVDGHGYHILVFPFAGINHGCMGMGRNGEQ